MAYQPLMNEEEVLLWPEELGVNMWQSIPVSNSLLTHKQYQPFRNPFRNKVREVYFSKEVCSFVSLKSSLCLIIFRLYLYTYTCRCITAIQQQSSSSSSWRCPWCNGYRRRKWTRRHEFKSWTRLIAFHIALIPLGKVWIQLFSLQIRVNSRTD